MARDVFNTLVATHSHSTAGGYTTEGFVGTQKHRLLLVWHDILFNASSRNHYTLIILPLLFCMLPHYQPLLRPSSPRVEWCTRESRARCRSALYTRQRDRHPATELHNGIMDSKINVENPKHNFNKRSKVR